MSVPTIEQIRTRAHQLWETAGRPAGHEDAFWYEAERELRQSDGTNNPEEKADTFLE
ncbi:DUF2934 domain-containing protein [Bradyrhizobium erythrophlei]|jgi:hypothetical protein|uniref:DUF2934 domain-containing protein n=1 Tax=Bradyrhizobium erythrophlei TaxID=1437360 RepID=A0A1M7UDF3_9BRAD|nr:DUF2934 domain-containing protein [Bradyrhizobium erythrophlei]SHN81023.1 Protein of unknown function [Bradyrhizobium erythrophlei]